GPMTINSIPPATLRAYRDHGRPAPRLEEGMLDACAILVRLPDLDIDLDEATQELEDEGVEKFVAPWRKLHTIVDERRRAALAELAGDRACRAPARSGGGRRTPRRASCPATRARRAVTTSCSSGSGGRR